MLSFMPKRLFLIFYLCLASIVFAQVGPIQSLQPRERLNFNADWLFHRDDPADVKPGEIEYPALKEYILASANEMTKGALTVHPSGNPGSEVSFVQPKFDDSGWRKLGLPHDYAVEGPFNIDLPPSEGKLPWYGVAWYRKHFTVPASDQGRRLFLDIDGAMSYSTVWINGQLAGGWPYGYSSYELDITPYLQIGTENVISIRLNNQKDSSRWYQGAGIYRNVWLMKTAPVHVAHWGTYLTTPEVRKDSATVNVKVAVQNQDSSDASVEVTNWIYELDPQDHKSGLAVAEIAPQKGNVIAGGRQDFEGKVDIKNPRLWDTKNPQRYAMITEVSQSGKVIDHYETPFGIRSIKFDPDQGFLLNGEHVEILGDCGHQDYGPLGIAFYPRAAERYLEKLKEMGCNALRTAHNMPTPELLDLCDKMGILVMDESFDCWHAGKKANDYHLVFNDWHERDLRAEYRRDRNHPCVIMWSLGNEILEQGRAENAPLLKGLVAIAHDEDPTRPATEGCNHGEGFSTEFITQLDLFGGNYTYSQFPKLHKKFPTLPLFESETASTTSSRGDYFFPVTKDAARSDFHVSAYDVYPMGWGSLPDASFKALEEYPYVAGEFVWTGWDYLGEPQPFDNDPTNLLNFSTDPVQKAKLQEELTRLGKIKTPAHSAYMGAIDLCGFPKDRFYLYQAHWRPDYPMVHILPHWNWPNRVGQVTPVYVYTSGDEAELFLNGQSLGRKKKEQYQYRLIWDKVVYAPGELKVVAYKNGQYWAETTVKTTGGAKAVQLQADRPVISSDGVDLCFVSTAIIDANGLPVPTVNNRVKYEITSGPGEIVATANGDQTDLEAFPNSERKAFHGLALAIIRAKAGQSGEIHLRAASDGLTSSEITIKTQ
jgi:beta-galactosidase